MSQSSTTRGSLPYKADEPRITWHEPIQLTYYLLAISGILATFVTWLVAHGTEIAQKFREIVVFAEAGPAGEIIRDARWFLIFAVLFGLFFAGLWLVKAGWFLVQRPQRSLNRVLLASEQGFHVADEFCKVLVRLSDAAVDARTSSAGPNGKWDALDQFLREEKPSLTLLLNQIARFFSVYTDHESCASLKLFKVKGGRRTHFIHTPVRDDQRRSRMRDIVDERYPLYDYRENTAFDMIVNDQDRRWFVANDLLRLEKAGRYVNGRKGWQGDYTATPVVPITDQYESSAIDKHNVIGFLCVDNKGGGFDEQFCAHVMFAFARITYGILKSFEPPEE